MPDIKLTHDDLVTLKYLVSKELNDVRINMILSPSLNNNYKIAENKHVAYLDHLLNKISMMDN